MNQNFSIGYYRGNEWGDTILDVLSDYPQIREVYFPLPDQDSGRCSLSYNNDSQEVLRELHDNLDAIRRLGIRLNLLLNASCYSDRLKDSSFTDDLRERLFMYVEDFGVSSVTTTQPSFALMIKHLFGEKVETRASVNMFLSSIDSMKFLDEEFDAYYPTRELYRSIDTLAKWREWADSHGKKLYALVNSGCMAFCPWAITDNNTTAHGINDLHMADGTEIPTCVSWFSKHKDLSSIVRGCFIRPEDVPYYSELFDGFKIATRAHFLPRLAVRAYIKGSYPGYLTDILEPSNTHFFMSGDCIANDLFPQDWFRKTSRCGRACHKCDYCDKIAGSIALKYNDDKNFRHFLFDSESELDDKLAAFRNKTINNHV